MTDTVLQPAAQRRRPETPVVLGADGADVNWTRVYLGFGGMAIGQFMALLDIQIVASSLVQIQSGIGASADEISWVQTIYLLAEVVIMPLTAYLTKMWGTRPFYVIAVTGFVVTSVLTGLSTSVGMMIIMRGLQGLFAGAMIPPVFATAMTVFPAHRRLTANVIVSLIVTLAPTIGPTLGGHLTEALSWRWLFFINAPVGLLVIFLVGRYANFDKGDPRLSQGIDWWGLGLMTAFLLSMQYVLEEGSSSGWFKDDMILWLGVTAVLTGVAFFWRQLTYWQPLVSLAAFRDRNFTLSMIMSFVTGVSLFGGTFLMPIFLGQIRGFSSAEVGTTMLVSGLTMFCAAPIAGRVVRLVGVRPSMVGGFALAAWAIQLGVRVTDQWGFSEFLVLQIARGAGTMIAMIAVQQMSVATLPASMMKDASGLLNLIRNVAGAVGLAALSTVLTHQAAVHYADLASAANAANPATQAVFGQLTQMMSAGGMADPEAGARKAMNAMIQRQASVLSFGDAFAVLSLGCWTAVVLTFFARPAPATAARPADLGAH
jgi:DHA2 family multidrug resistance protein